MSEIRAVFMGLSVGGSGGSGWFDQKRTLAATVTDQKRTVIEKSICPLLIFINNGAENSTS